MEKWIANLKDSTEIQLMSTLSAAQQTCRTEVLWDSLLDWDGSSGRDAIMNELLQAVDVKEVVGLFNRSPPYPLDLVEKLMRGAFSADKCCKFDLSASTWLVAAGMRTTLPTPCLSVL